MEDKQERAKRQRLKDSLNAAEAVESGKIPKQDKHKSGLPAGNSHSQSTTEEYPEEWERQALHSLCGT
jgi:hypothetical protein